MGPGPELGGSRYPARTSRVSCHDNPYRVSFNCRHRRGPTTGPRPAGRARAVRSKCRANARTHVTCAAARARTLAPLGPAPAARHLLDTFVIASSVSFASSVDDVSAFVALSQRVISLQRRVDVRPQRASNEHPASRSSCLVTRAVPVLSPFYRLGTYLYLHELPWFRIMY